MSTTNPSTTNQAAVLASAIPTMAESTDSHKVFPSTEAQLEIWLSSKQGIEANCAYNEITSIRFQGDLDTVALNRALKTLLDRHESLRSTFSDDGLRMRVNNKAEFKLEILDWTDLDADECQLKRLNLVQDQACLPFDLEQGPLFRASLQRLSADESYLTISAHHIVLDGWSLAILVRDLGFLYNRERGFESESLPDASAFSDYSSAMDDYFRSADSESDRRFWSGQFSESVPILDLPTSGSRPALRTYFARRYDHVIKNDLVESLRKLGSKSGCSLFNTMLAAFNTFVARISGSDDFCVGIPTAGQLAMDQPDLIGHCVNTMPLRANVDTDQDFINQLKKTRSQMLDAVEHQRYTFGKILTDVSPPRDPSRPPMVTISFNVDPAIDCSKIGFEGLKVEILVEPRLFENFEWFINGIVQDDKSIELQVQYNTDLFSADFMRMVFTGFEEFLGHVVDQPEKRLADLPVLSVSQRQTMLVDWNETARDFSCTQTLHEEFQRQAKLSPDKIAAKFKERSFTYAQLDRKSNQFAHLLVQQGVGAGDLVGVCVPRNEKMLVVLLGVLKSGAGYVPLDPSFPQERLHYMCEHSQLKMVVGTSDVVDLLKSFEKPTLIFEELDSDLDSADDRALDVVVSTQSTCYVIYTSGSTGKPKGVEIPHGAVVNFLYAMMEQPGFGANDSVLAVTTLSFDIAVLEIFLPLIAGGTTVIASKAVTADGELLAQAINEHNVTLFQSTPASLRLMIAAGWEGKKDLKVLCGGEPMPADLVGPLLERSCELWNMYGPTETTVWSSVWQVTDADAPILIGKPIANTQIYILDENLQPVPVGADGEIYIGGAGVTMGYLHQEALTNERFVKNPFYNPFRQFCNHRLYRTGDLGRFRADGNIQFLRRNDKQVKVRGFRIELGEIESAIKSIEQVEQAVTIVREDVPGDTRLVAYWVGAGNTQLTNDDVRERLRESLPYYMVPQHVLQLDSFPQTNNGKIDYKSLPAPTANVDEDSDEFRPQTAIQRFIANTWKQVLNIDEVYTNDNFFDLGGHSLLVMKVITAIEQQTGARLTPPEFLVGTLEQLADRVNEEAEVVDDCMDSGDTEHAVTLNQQGSVDDVPVNEDDSVSEPVTETGLFRKIAGFWD